MINIILPKTDSEDFIPLTAGRHDCPPYHSFGPHMRDFTIIHFCLRGKGTLYNSAGAHRIRSGELFIMRRGEITTYTADSIEPWQYVWISFIGRLSETFNACPDVAGAPEGFAERLAELVRGGVKSPDAYIAMLYELKHRLLSDTKEPEDKLSEIRRAIKYEYMKELTVGGLAKSFGFERSYLYRLFKSRYGKSVKEYLTEVRMLHAKSLLESGHSVSVTAALVGYGDEFNFSKAYKNYFGSSPGKSKPRISD